jgi:hypothetical protein
MTRETPSPWHTGCGSHWERDGELTALREEATRLRAKVEAQAALIREAADAMEKIDGWLKSRSGGTRLMPNERALLNVLKDNPC